jgi:putative transposase
MNGVETKINCRRSAHRGRPYGQDGWVATAAADLGIESSLRPRGRPRKEPATD